MDWDGFGECLDGLGWILVGFGSSPSRMRLCVLFPEVYIVSIFTRGWPAISSPVSRMHLFILYP